MKNMQNLVANWPAPNNIRALTTTRLGGVSIDAYATNNLGLRVDDIQNHVIQNRLSLIANHNLPGEPFWLDQTHTNICTEVIDENANRLADATITQNKKIPLVVLTADCVPIVICNQQGDEIAAIHAGWKGLESGIIENTAAKFSKETHNYLAWIGPSICQKCYATGSEVYQKFTDKYAYLEEAFTKRDAQFFADLPKIAKLILNNLGINQVYLSNACTFEENDKYYSYRRQSKTGRIATLIWFQE